MCNSVNTTSSVWPHKELNTNCKRTLYGYKVFRKDAGKLYPLFQLWRTPYSKDKVNTWDESAYGDGFCFFPRKKEAITLYKSRVKNGWDVEVCRVKCTQVLATYISAATTGKEMKVGVCKKFQILKDKI